MLEGESSVQKNGIEIKTCGFALYTEDAKKSQNVGFQVKTTDEEN